jgi:lipoprotein LprG
VTCEGDETTVHRTLTRCLVTLLLGLLVMVATGCTGGGPETTPAQIAHRLDAAKRALDRSASIRLTLRTDGLPAGVDGITKVAGVASHAPAFRGTIMLAGGGFLDGQSVDVVAIGGDVYAKTPFSSSFIRVDPADFDAPDPSSLMRADGGLSTLLAEATQLSETGQRRQGDLVVSTYSGSVPGASVARIFPSASPDRPFEATFSVDDDDQLHGAELTGPFYRGKPAVTYHLGVVGSDEPVKITRP